MKSTIILLVSLSVAYVGALQDIKTRIVGGRPARFGEFPYQVALRQPGSNEENSYLAFCGGSIIDKEWVLTAAHCFWGEKKDNSIGHKRTADDVEVIPGGQLNLLTMNAMRSHIPVEKVIVHPDYNHTNQENDIALLKVKGKLLVSMLVDGRLVYKGEKIPLAQPDQGDFVGSPAVVSGYGHTEEAAAPTKFLMMTDNIKILPNSACEGFHPNYKSDMMLCAGAMEGKYDSCNGDSGGPITVKKEVKEGKVVKVTKVVKEGKIVKEIKELKMVKVVKDVLVGVTSYGPKKCGSANAPGVYSRVSKYYPFIQDVLSGKITEGKKE